MKTSLLRSLRWGCLGLMIALSTVGCGGNQPAPGGMGGGTKGGPAPKAGEEKVTETKPVGESAAVGAKSVAIAANGWQVPVDVSNPTSPARADWLNLGWNTFVALSWPAQSKGEPGQPNERVSITDPQSAAGPTVWLTYLAKEQLFQPKGADPGSWTSPTVTPATQDGLPVLDGFSKIAPDKFENEFNEAFSGAPLIDVQQNYVLYEIRLNQAEFTYVDVNQYYDADNQIASFKTDPISFVGFPKTGQDITDPTTKQPVTLPDWAQQGALEIKASWRMLTSSDDATRYYTQKSYYKTPDGQVQGPVTLGLVGLHILRLTPTTGSTWYWATFEQVDNLGESGHTASFSSSKLPDPTAAGYSYQPAAIELGKPLPTDPTAVNVKRVFPIPGDVQTANAAYQAALKGTVWQYYQLIDVMNPVPEGTPGAAPVPLSPNPNPPPNSGPTVFSGSFANTGQLANVTLETYQQLDPSITGTPPQSCVNCHGQFGYPQGVPSGLDPAQLSNYQIFTFLLGDATSSTQTKPLKQPKK